MTVEQPHADLSSWLAEDDLNELNEEWIDRSETSRASPNLEIDSGTVNHRNTYDSIIIHNSNDNGTTKLDSDERRKATPKWKRAIQQNPNLRHDNEENSTWNMFFQSPSVRQSKEDQSTAMANQGSTHTNLSNHTAGDSTSKSRLKVFQKHDTYTNSRLENLLGVLDLSSTRISLPRRPESAQMANESVSNPALHKSVNSDSDLYSSTNHERFDWNSVDRRDITTQDFMDNADSLMKKLMGSVPEPVEEPTSPTEESNFPTDSFESMTSNSLDPAYPQFEPANESPIYVGHNGSSHAPGSDRQSSVIVHSKEVTTKLNENKRNIAVIKQEDVKNIIPEKIGSMNYDAENRIWRRNGKSELSQAKGGSSMADITDENDVFQGIDDLSEDVASADVSEQRSKENESQKKTEVSGLKAQNIPSNKDQAQQNDSLQQKLRSIKSCLIDTPRSTTVSGAFDKEVSFLLPGREARPILAAVGITRSHTGDVTQVSQIDSSFSHSLTYLVKAFTDRYPNQMLWDKLYKIDISNSGLESLAKLDSICPQLKTLNASHNNLSVVQGIPLTVTELDVSSNKLSNLSNFGGLANVHYLNISNNAINSFTCLSQLIHLRKLTADGCRMTNLNGLSNIEGLLQLSMQGGQLVELDGQVLQCSLLQTLNLSNNRVQRVKNLENLKSLRSLDIGEYQ